MKTAAVWTTGRLRALTAGGLGLVALLGGSPAARADEGTEVIAVFSRASDDYVRTKRPDGSLETEFYSFGEGGYSRGASHDPSIDGLVFTNVARTIAPTLTARHYAPAQDPQKTRLLVMVYWGTTVGARENTDTFLLPYLQADMSPMTLAPLGTDAVGLATAPGPNASSARSGFSETALAMIGMADHLRAAVNRDNAGILGYEAKLTEMEALRFTPARFDRDDLLDDIEFNRYFVVLMAYDFQLLWKKKKAKLLWETRFSIRERGNDFSKQLANMAQYASRYFGKDSHGLVRKPLPEGEVTLGEMKVLESVRDK